jgi:ABC-2 type transport system ATP-binding protein
MRVLDVIVFFARLKGVGAGEARREGARWLERMGLGEWRSAKVETLSKGMQQKVQFIATVLHRPELLVLDEPTSGLDPVNQEVLTETILEARREGRTVLFSTHNMSQAEALCEGVCIIADGQKVLDGDLREIRRANRGNRWRIRYDAPPAGAQEAIERAAGEARVERREEGWEVELPRGDDPRALMAALATLEAAPTRFERVEPSLHEIFVERVGATAGTARRREVAHA